jgi:Xaa-Pro aminopeptidase
MTLMLEQHTSTVNHQWKMVNFYTKQRYRMRYRLENLRAALRERNIEAFLITSPTNRHYISGFSGSAGALLVTATTALLFTDFRYLARAMREAPDFTVHRTSVETPLPRLLAEIAADYGVQRITFEDHHVTVAQFTKFAKAINDADTAVKPDLVPLDGENVVEPLRETKDMEELLALRQAVDITDAAFEAVLPMFRPDHSERQAAWMLEVAMRERGADGIAFPIIVAAGRKSAQPHAAPGDECLGSGQPIIIDMGARYQSYHADMTRTIVLGEPDERFRQVYSVVLEAQQHAIANLRAGLTCAEADALARDNITAAGFGKAFGHSLGHGVGLDIHEGPSLRHTNDKLLHAGNVFSVEPGIYLDNWGGVRIEDLVLLTEQGSEVLTGAQKLVMG